jgi:DNA-binding response OmpR family regulator
MRVILCGLGAILTNALDYRLRKYSCSVINACDPREALNIVHYERADVLILSANIPNFRLTTFIGLIREDFHSAIPIILVTDPDGEPDSILDGIDAGADDFVTFPFKPAELITRIQLLLHRNAIPAIRY